MNKGKIIVLEGLDGCGKSTQLELAEKYLSDNKTDYRAISFPNYNSDSGRIVSGYLKGEIPCNGEHGAYAASSFYAVDRYITYATDWGKDYERGAVILSGRYTTSNAIYQMTKLNACERESYLNWLWDYEYKKLGLPEPDMVIFLNMPLEVSQKLLSKRYDGDESKKDIHEANMQFMAACRDNALFTAERCGWNIVDCAENGEPLPVEQIAQKISALIDETLSK